MDRIILAFGHKRLRGKDTSGIIAFENLRKRGIAVRRDSFAYSLKEHIGKGVFGMSEEQLYGDSKTEKDLFWGFTPRWMLQQVGTELMRKHIHENIWAKTLELRAQNAPSTSVVITDLRFWNEVEAVKRLGGYVIKCERQIAFDPEQDKHQSETDLDNFVEWDYVINNTGTIEELENQIKRMIEDIIKEQ